MPVSIFADTMNKSEDEKILVRMDQQDKIYSYTFDFPKDAASIKESSIKFSGNGKILSTKVDTAKREITIVFEGKAKDLPSKTVYGFSSIRQELFPANPGNAMCRYSDGVRWQISSLNTTDFRQNQKDYRSIGAAPADIPYKDLMHITTASKPSIPTSGIFWFDGTGKDAKAVNSSNVNMAKINVPKGAAQSTMIKSYDGQIVYPRDYDPYNPYIGIQYKAQQIDFDDPEFRKIHTDNPAFLTGHAICKLYPVNYGFYVAAEATGTVYDFGGSVSYEYIRPREATLIGKLTADPTSTRFEDKDVPVNLIIEGEVLNIEDAGAIDYYKIFLKNGVGDLIVDGEIIPANRKTTVKLTSTYKIPKAKMNNVNEYTESFSARIYAYYKSSSYYVDSKNGKFMDSGLLNASSLVTKQSAPPPPPPNRESPVAIIKADAELMLGDDTYFDGLNSYDPDGEIVRYAWNNSSAKLPIEGNVDGGWTWYDKLGNHKVQLCVVDNDGLSDCTYHSLVVTEPTITAYMSQSGTLKQNRKVTFTSSSRTPSRYPEDLTKTTWSITNLTTGSTTDVKVDGVLKGTRSVDVLFKQPGEYRVTLSVENTAGYKDTISRAYTISPDDAPYVDFSFQQKVYRDPLDGNQATFQLTDYSYSFDGDTIVSRKWYVVYDANNDGIYSEQKVLFNSGNETYVEYKTKKVGKYAFYLEVQEEFGQPTIEKFVTTSDRRTSNTWD